MRLPDLNDLIQDLQLAKEIAIKNENVNGLVNATMSQAKLLGLDKASAADCYSPPSTIDIKRVIVDPVNNTETSY